MPVGRDDRREARRVAVTAAVGEKHAEAALDILELGELAWHDCFDEASPPDDIIDDIFVCAEGDLSRFARATRLAITDWRDLQLWAARVRVQRGHAGV